MNRDQQDLSMRAGPALRAVTDPLSHSQSKDAVGQLLNSSGSRQWTEVAAEFRQHPAVLLPPLEQRHVEICIATQNDNALITRKAGGEVQESRSERGRIWLCPAGVKSDETQSHAPVEFLHLYLPPSRFDSLSDICGGAPVLATAVGYLNGIQDEIIHQAGLQILTEMKQETAAGRVLVDALALFLTVRLAHNYAITQGQAPELEETRHGLGDTRLARVLDYMRDHIDQDVSIEDLAAVACLSAFHFARMFRASVGMPPYRYLSSLRLERARNLLSQTDTSLTEIALASCFSSQANFTRAFRAATGVTPGRFRRMAR